MVCRQNVLKHEQDQQIVETVEIQSKSVGVGGQKVVYLDSGHMNLN